MAITEERQAFLGDIVHLKDGQSYAKVMKYMKEVYVHTPEYPKNFQVGVVELLLPKGETKDN